MTTTARTAAGAGTAVRLFDAINRVVEPMVRCGFGNSLAGPGLFVVETTGRRTGERRRVPLLGVRFGDRLVVTTVRRRSHWAANLEHAGGGAVWIGGRRHPTTARVARPAGATVAGLTIGCASNDGDASHCGPNSDGLSTATRTAETPTVPTRPAAARTSPT